MYIFNIHIYLNDLDQNECPYAFMQDNAPMHIAKLSKGLEAVDIPFPQWPGNSPELNEIENVWNTLKCLVYKKENKTKQLIEVFRMCGETKKT